jgi:hypothetical protein
LKLEGVLTTFPLRELIEMTVYSSVTGVLTIYGPAGSGQIFFRDGQPYHADYGTVVGDQAVVRLFEANDAHFSFVADAVSEEETLWHDPMDLIELSERQAARWSRVRTEITDLALVPRLVNGSSDQFLIDGDHWPVISAVDGVRSLSVIADFLGRDTLEVCEAAVELRRSGMLVLDQPPPPPAHAPVTSSTTAPGTRPRHSIFDRILATLPPEEPAPAPAPAPAPGASATTTPPAAPPPVEEDPILRLLRG